MRLTASEIKTIKCHSDESFGTAAKVYLFGSRVDDSKKGGDIDLYVVPADLSNLHEKKIKFLSALGRSLGDQKIDLIIAQHPDREIEQQALSKGIELNLNNLRLTRVFSECDKHLQRINEAGTDLAAFMPITATKYANLSKDEVQALDQYLFRFAKLQDAMGEKLFRNSLARFVENAETLPFLDVLNQLEKYLAIELTNEWLDLRKICNQLAHEYEDDGIAMANSINLIYAKKLVIEDIYLTLKARIMP